MSSTIPDNVRQALDTGSLGIPCTLGKIDHGLDQFFSGDETRTRASLANFAIYSENPADLTKNGELIQEITTEHACRAILVTLALDEPTSDPAGWISAHCHLDPRGQKSVCSEQIVFVLQGDSSRLVANIVLSHLRSDLPLIMWWQGNLSENFQEELYSRVDRLIVDSCGWDDASEQFTRLKSAIYHRSTGTQRPGLQFLFHDLAFTRGHRHRLAIAHAFDNPFALNAVRELTEVVIECSPRHRTVALYIAAWIATQLQAKLQQQVQDTYKFEKPSGPLNIRIALDDSIEHPLGKISMAGPGLKLQIEDSSNPHFLEVQTQAGEQKVEELLPAPCTSQCDLVGEVLMRGGNNLLLGKIFPLFLTLNGVQVEPAEVAL